MLILDTDHLSLIDEDTAEAFNIGRRLAAVPPSDVAVTIISYEEQMRGWLAYVARADTTVRQLEAYERLRRHVERFRGIPVLPFDAQSAVHLEQLHQSRVRIGTMDLKIAAICLAHDAILLTRNLRDFDRVPGLRAEDWST